MLKATRLQCVEGLARCSLCGFEVNCKSELAHICKSQSHVARPLPCGPGCHLRKILSGIGILYSPGCKCKDNAAKMDAWGSDECQRRAPEIIEMLRAEAAERGLPFSSIAAAMLLKVAIRRARRDAKLANVNR